MKGRRPKRYVLLVAEGELGQEDLQTLSRFIEHRLGKVSLISPKGNNAALIVKTDNSGAATLVESCADLKVGGKRVAAELVSGNIGKLKRRAEGSGGRDIAQVPQ